LSLGAAMKGALINPRQIRPKVDFRKVVALPLLDAEIVIV
jgi:hypothetical protein